MNEVPPIISGGKSRNDILWIILIIVVCIPVFFFGCFLSAPFLAVHKADAGFRKAKKTIDPKQLLDWEQKIVTKYPFTNQEDDMLAIPQAEIPEQLQKLYSRATPNAVIFRDDSNKSSYVRIIWGGGFFQWHLSIGRTNTLTTNDFGYWTEGVYYNRQ